MHSSMSSICMPSLPLSEHSELQCSARTHSVCSQWSRFKFSKSNHQKFLGKINDDVVLFCPWPSVWHLKTSALPFWGRRSVFFYCSQCRLRSATINRFQKINRVTTFRFFLTIHLTLSCAAILSCLLWGDSLPLYLHSLEIPEMFWHT